MVFHTKPLIRYYAAPIYTAMCLALLACAVFLHITFYNDWSIQSIFCILFTDALALFNLWVLFNEFLEKFYAKLKVTDDAIIWRCIFRRRHMLQLDRCRFVGVELEAAWNQMEYPFIYFSTKPYPKEFTHKINKLENSDEFIKFWYTEKLAKYLLEQLPKEKTGGLQYYYSMKHYPRKRKRKGTK